MAMKNCPNCRNVIASDAKACPFCGKHFGGMAIFGTRVGCGSVVLILFIIFIVFVMVNKDQSLEDSKINSQNDAMQRRIQAASGNSPAQAPQGSKWTYLEIPDDMGRGATKYAQLTSDTTLQLGFPYQGGTQIRLDVRDSPKYGRDVIFTIDNGQLQLPYDSKRVAVQFDGGRIEYFYFVSAESGTDSMFVRGSDRLIKRIKASKTMKIDIPIYDHGEATVAFSVAGLVWPPQKALKNPPVS